MTPLNSLSMGTREVTVREAEFRTEVLLQSRGTRMGASAPEAASASLQGQVAALHQRVAALESQLEAELPGGGLKSVVKLDSARPWEDLERELHMEREARAALVTRIQQDLEMQLLVEKEARAALAVKIHAMDQQVQAEQETRSALVSKVQQESERRVQESAAIIGAEIDRLETQLQVMGAGKGAGMEQSIVNAEVEGQKARAAVAEMKSRLASMEAAAPWEECLQKMEIIQFDLLKQMDLLSQDLHKFVEEQAGEAQAAVESLQREVPSELRRVVSQITGDQSQAARQLESVRSDMDKRIEEELAVATKRQELEASRALKEVRQELSQKWEDCSSRMEAMHVALGSVKQMVLKELEVGKIWGSDLETVREDLAQKIEECRGDLTKGVVACQGRLTSTSLSLHDKVQEVEDAMKQSLAPFGEVPGHGGQGSIADVLAKIKEVSQLREFTMDQTSKLHNAMASEIANLERKVESGLSDIEETRAALASAAESSLQQAQKECASTREFCNYQAKEAQISASKLQQQLGRELGEQTAKLQQQFSLKVKELQHQMSVDFKEQAAQSADEFRCELSNKQAAELPASSVAASAAPSPSAEQLQELRLSVREELLDGRAVVMQEVGDQLKGDLAASEAKLMHEQEALRTFTMEQHGQLWMALEDVQAELQKLTGLLAAAQRPPSMGSQTHEERKPPLLPVVANGGSRLDQTVHVPPAQTAMAA